MASPFDTPIAAPDPVAAGAAPDFTGTDTGPQIGSLNALEDTLMARPSAPAIMPAAPTTRPMMPPLLAPQTAAPKSPNFLSMLMPILASTLIGRRDPRAVAAGMGAYMQGRELKRQETETAQQTQERKAAEQADFYGRALGQAQQFDDPVAFAQWKDAIAPVAQLHGIDPNVFTFNDEKAETKTKKDAADLLATLDKEHPDGNYSVDWKDPKTGTTRRVTRADLAKIAGLGAFDAQGKALSPTGTVNAQRFVADVQNPDGTTTKMYAFEDPRTKRITNAAGKDITDLIVPPDANAQKPERVEGLLDGKPTFAQQRVVKGNLRFFDNDGNDVTKRFRPNQTAGEREAAQGDEAPTLSPGGLDAAAKNYAQTGQLPAMGMGKSSAGVRAQIINRAAELYPDLDIAGNRQDFNANNESLKALQKQRDAIGAFEQTAQKNIDLFLKQAANVADTGIPLLNKPARWVSGQVLGSGDQAAYEAARQVAVNEIAKITSNPTLAGTLSDSARHEVETFNPQNATLQQTIAVMTLLKQDMQNRSTSLDDAIATVKKRRGSGNTAAPAAPAPGAGTTPPPAGAVVNPFR